MAEAVVYNARYISFIKKELWKIKHCFLFLKAVATNEIFGLPF